MLPPGGGGCSRGAHQGRDVATLELVMEGAGLLMYGQLEGLGVSAAQAGMPPLAAGLSQLSTAEAAQLPMVVFS